MNLKNTVRILLVLIAIATTQANGGFLGRLVDDTVGAAENVAEGATDIAVGTTQAVAGYPYGEPYYYRGPRYVNEPPVAYYGPGDRPDLPDYED